MARVALLCPDLLFGSKVEGGLAAAGHQVERVEDGEALGSAADGADVLVVDLTDDSYDGAAVVEALRAAGAEEPALGFYAHVDVEARRRAAAAGFELVVPRSRMAREMAALVERLTEA